MPLVRLDILEGQSEAFVANLLDATHRVMVQVFALSIHDRHQIVCKHSRDHLVIEDTGLGIERTGNVVVVSITSRPSPEHTRLRFYERLCRELQSSCGISPSDVVVVITPDWTPGIAGRGF